MLAGIVASTFVEHYGCRPTTLVGAVVLVLSLGISSVSPNIAMIYVVQSAFAGEVIDTVHLVVYIHDYTCVAGGVTFVVCAWKVVCSGHVLTQTVLVTLSALLTSSLYNVT